MKAISGNLKAKTVEVAQYERLNKSLLNPSLLSGLLVKGVIALFVICIGILCNDGLVNRLGLIGMLKELSGHSGQPLNVLMIYLSHLKLAIEHSVGINPVG